MDWRAGEAKWRQIERVLVDEIGQGLFAPGSRLPTELELAARFGVNRHTVRQAIGALAEADVLRVEQGRGTFVQESVLDYALSSRTRFSQNVADSHMLPHKRLTESETLRAGRRIAGRLALDPEDFVVRLFSVSEADSVPVACSESFLPARRFPTLPEVVAETGSLTEALARLGVPDYHRRETRVTAQLPSGKVAAFLRQPRTRPVLVTENVDVDGGGVPIECGTTWFASDRVQLIVPSPGATADVAT
ncbi:MAG: phosphonate metabolism transcriptional regulator PhnF [Rhodobacterales bacterium]|nr:phosphonate metabolism transcriptional regulator PhnF [Rhodobacterales bacterium]